MLQVSEIIIVSRFNGGFLGGAALKKAAESGLFRTPPTKNLGEAISPRLEFGKRKKMITLAGRMEVLFHTWPIIYIFSILLKRKSLVADFFFFKEPSVLKSLQGAEMYL